MSTFTVAAKAGTDVYIGISIAAKIAAMPTATAIFVFIG
jgi:hypothetical protein